MVKKADVAGLHNEIEGLKAQVSQLRSRLERDKARKAGLKKTIIRLFLMGFLGRSLEKSFRSWVFADWSSFPREETVDLAVAITRRVVVVGVVGFFVAMLPSVLVLWQIKEIRDQNQLLRFQHFENFDMQGRMFLGQIKAQSSQHSESIDLIRRQLEGQSAQHLESMKKQGEQLELLRAQAAYSEKDLLIVRRAQLLATIYDCAEVSTVREFAPLPTIPPVQRIGDPEPEICYPRAGLRSRNHAVQALVEIEGRRGVKIDLRKADLSEMDLSGLNLVGADLSGAYMRLADLSRTDARKANFIESDLSGALLHQADLSSASLIRTNLTKAQMVGTKLTNGDLEMADFSSTLLLGADLRGANLRGSRIFAIGAKSSGSFDLSAHSLTQAQIDWAKGDSTTILPSNLSAPDHWVE